MRVRGSKVYKNRTSAHVRERDMYVMQNKKRNRKGKGTKQFIKTQNNYGKKRRILSQ